MSTPHPVTLEGLLLEPQYRERVWGGTHLGQPSPETGTPIGEAWIVYEESKITSGPHKDRTLGEVAAEYGADLLGSRAVSRTGTRFPLLIKLLDCADWLSLQVHPDDAMAVELEGQGHFGKTEAWYFIKTEDGAGVISGVKPGTTREELARAISDGKVIELAHYQPVSDGDALLMMAGTIHALGPGLLVYEVQQTSDITYRIFDWDRPQTAGRALHIEQSIAVSSPTSTGKYVEGMPLPEDGGRHLLDCLYFSLDVVQAEHETLELDTHHETFHALTVIEGEVEIAGPSWSHKLTQYQSIVIPASTGSYKLHPKGHARAILSAVP
ncbi:MAG: type I phosphomannose isomerase catalytic subunit [Chloroflexota bacterium]